MKTHEIIKHRRHRQHQDQTQHGKVTRFFRNAAIFAALSLIGAALVIAGIYAGISQGLPQIDGFERFFDENLPPTIVTDREDAHALLVLSSDMLKSEKLAIGETGKPGFSQNLINTVVASRQPDFWSSSGAALPQGLRSLFSGEPETIAEELAEQVYAHRLGSGLRKSVLMKLLAMQVTERYSPRMILTWYLNSAYFGQLAFGADSAAKTYLNRSAADLTLAESVFLSAILNAPALNPIDSQGAMKQSYLAEVSRLERTGYLSSEQVAELSSTNFVIYEPPQLNAEVQTNPGVQSALSEAYKLLGQEVIERGGYRIRSTIDFSLQQLLECLLTPSQISETEETAAGTGTNADPAERCALNPLTPADAENAASILNTLRTAPVSAVVLDISSGEVLAAMEWSLGASGLRKAANRFGLHEPGTSLTPFVALAGFSQRISPSSMSWDTAETRVSLPADYRNPDGKFHGPISLRTAINEDLLGPVMSLLNRLGSSAVLNRISQFGLGSLGRFSPEALLLNSGAAAIDQLAMAYIPFAAGEVSGSGDRAYPDAQTILDIRSPLSEPIPLKKTVSLSVLDENLSYLMTHLLAEGDQAFRYLDRPAALKIGRIYQSGSVWIIGYTPDILTAVYLGESGGAETDGELILNSALTLWQTLMRKATENYPVRDWTRPQQVLQLNVCVPSGKLPSAICPEIESEVFLSGSEPYETDDLYVSIPVNAETQRLATVRTPFNRITEAVYMRVPAFAEKWAQENGVPAIPSEYDTVQEEPVSEILIYQPAAFAVYQHETRDKTLIEVKAELAVSEAIQTVQVSLGSGMNPTHWQEITRADALENGRWTLAEMDSKMLTPGLHVVRVTVVTRNGKVYRADQFFTVK